MLKRTMGKTGLLASVVSFGGIPIQRSDAENTCEVVDALLEKGVNYIDTARGYTVSEGFLGKALEGRRDKFILATKSMVRSYEGMKKEVDISLGNLKTDYIDIYQIHNIPLKDFDEVFGPDGAYKALLEAKEMGKIGHIGATTHSADALRKLVEEEGDKIETLMFPFNIIENQGEEILRAAREKGIATIAMKPLAGGNIDDVDLAIRYILSKDCIDIVIPGMGDRHEVEADVCPAEGEFNFTSEDEKKAEEIKAKLGTTFCRRCGYCAPCTVGINIPSNFLFDNYLRHYEGLQEWAKGRYDSLDKHASDCIECGACETRCPYDLPIRDMLKRVAADFGK